jgi:6-phosphofructokinase 1
MAAIIDRSHEVLEGLTLLGIDGLIAIGGDGSLRILHRLMKHAGLPFIAIPKTIDNDVQATDRAIGFELGLGGDKCLRQPAFGRHEPAAHHGT